MQRATYKTPCYWVCLGCFTIYKKEPETVCCEKRHGEPFAIDRISEEEAMELYRDIRDYTI